MIFPKVLILTLFIFGTFAKDSNKNVEERIEALERKLTALKKADEKEDIKTNIKFKVIEKKLSALTKAIEMEDDASNLTSIVSCTLVPK